MSFDDAEPERWGSFVKVLEYMGHQIWRMPNNKYCIVRIEFIKPYETVKVGLESASECINYIDNL